MASSKSIFGKLLLADGVITPEQLEDALRHQVVYGGRLGTNLIELGYATHDQIALGLAKKLGVPAALTKHLSAYDRTLVERIPADVARRCLAFPIARLRGATDKVAVCFRDPIDEAIRTIAHHLQATVVPSIASEAAILYWLEVGYGLARPQRYVLAPPGATRPLPGATTRHEAAVDPDPSTPRRLRASDDSDDDVDIDFDDPPTLPDQFELVDLDDLGVVKDQVYYDTESQAFGPLAGSPRRSRRASLGGAIAPLAPAPEAIGLAEAQDRIAGAADREQVAEAALAYLASFCTGGLMMTVKGELALGYRGFGGTFDADSVESIVVPLGVPSVFQSAADASVPYRGSPMAGAHAVQRRFFKLFPGGEPDEVVVIPARVKDRLVCMFVGSVDPSAGSPPDPERDLGAIAGACERAFLRLIRQAKQQRS